jgi:hypothetical protein
MSDIEKTSATWAAVCAWAEQEIEHARAILESHGHGIEETEFRRGRVSVLKELLGLPDRRHVVPKADTYGR